jgi:hypothetical protein
MKSDRIPQNMMQWGVTGIKGDPSNPGVISDVFGRVGGPTDSSKEQV